MGPLRSNIGIKGARARPAAAWLRRILVRGPQAMAAATAPVPTHERLVKLGDRVGGFRIISEPIGRGSYGHVYLAQHVAGPSRGRVALKVAEATNENFLDEEAQLMREITRLGVNVVVRWKPPRGRHNSPALIGRHHLPDGRSLDYLVMEYVGGGNLQHILDTLPEHRLRQRDALAIVSAVAAGLKILHAHGILHHDIKPENILLRQPLHPIGWIKPDPVLIDFGAGFKASDLGKIALGTDGYTAPERYAKVHNLPASDIYSLGQVLQTLLGGPDQVMPVGVHRLIERMTAHDPTMRPSAAEVAATTAQLRKRDRSMLPVLRRPLTPREMLVGALSPAMIGLILLGAAARPTVAKDIIVNLASEPRAIVGSVIDSVGSVDLAIPTVTPISFWQTATPTAPALVAGVAEQTSPIPPAPTETPTSTSTTVQSPTAGTDPTGGGTAVAAGGTANVTVTPSADASSAPETTSTTVLGRIDLTDPDTNVASPTTPSLPPLAGSPTSTPTEDGIGQLPSITPQPSLTATVEQPATATMTPGQSNGLPNSPLLFPNPQDDGAPEAPTATRRPVRPPLSPTPTPEPEPPAVLNVPTVVPTASPTATEIPPTATLTPTEIPPTATLTPTEIPPTATLTPTEIPPTATLTPTEIPPTATLTPTEIPRAATMTPTSVAPITSPTALDVAPTSTPTELALIPAPTSGAPDVSPDATPAATDGPVPES